MADFIDREQFKKVKKSKDYKISIISFIFGFLFLIGSFLYSYLIFISIILLVIGGYFIFEAWKKYFI